MLELTLHNATRGRAISLGFIRSVINFALEYLKLSRHAVEIGVFIIGEQRMRELNRRALGKNRPTNVLSFPLLDRRGLSYAMYKKDPIALGDIFLCLPVIRQEACLTGERLTDRLARLIVHGILHLSGHDHESSLVRAHAMERLETHILRAFQQI